MQGAAESHCRWAPVWVCVEPLQLSSGGHGMQADAAAEEWPARLLEMRAGLPHGLRYVNWTSR